MVAGQSLCRWSMEGLRPLWSWALGPILGKLGEVAGELLPNVLRLRLTAHTLQWGPGLVQLSAASWWVSSSQSGLCGLFRVDFM